MNFRRSNSENSLALANHYSEMTACVKASRHQTQPSTDSGGQGECVSVSGQSEVAIHGGLVETLLAAASREDELISELLGAITRNARRKVMALAAAITANRGATKETEAAVAEERAKFPQAKYEDKLLEAISREEIILESLVAADVRGERAKLFSLCRALAENRKQFDPEFKKKQIKLIELDL
jgi:hypothetical protein